MLRRVLPLLLMAAATLTACDDPSNVGLGLVGSGAGGNPTLQRAPATPFAFAGDDEISGGAALVLAGEVDDPLLATIRAEGYVDFGEPVAFGNGVVSQFRQNTLTGAYLELAYRYVYGDTTAPVAYELRSLTDEFVQAGATTDTTIAAGGVVTAFSYPLPDTLVRVPLPAAWVAANDTTLRGLAVATTFHGFKLNPTGGNAVLGYAPTGVRLYAIAGQDTVVFRGAKTITTTRRLGQPNIPDGYVLLQDGMGRQAPGDTTRGWSSYRVGLDFGGLPFQKSALSRLALELIADTLVLKNTPPGFVRPLLREVEAIGLDDKGGVIFGSNGDFLLRVTGKLADDATLTLAGARLTAVGQLLLRGQTSPVQALLVQPPPASGTLNALLLRAPGTPEAPRFAFTTVSSD